MKVTIKLLSGTSLAVESEKDSTVASLKAKISEAQARREPE